MNNYESIRDEILYIEESNQIDEYYYSNLRNEDKRKYELSLNNLITIYLSKIRNFLDSSSQPVIY